MARKRKNDFDYQDISESDITTVLADDINFKGNISFKSSLMIKGSFEGDLRSEGLLLVSKEASIRGTINTSILISYGLIDGDVHADKNVILCDGSNLTGDIYSPNFIVESGAKFEGKCSMPGIKKNTAAAPKQDESTETSS